MFGALALSAISTPAARAAANHCVFQDNHVKVMDITGHIAQEFNFHLTYTWCYNGRNVTSVQSVCAYGTASWPWKNNATGCDSVSYDSHPDSFETMLFAQGSFSACTPLIHICRDRAPWIRVFLLGNGQLRMAWNKG
jgi:hypothetical protein